MRTVIDIAGRRFGRFTVIRMARVKDGKVRWECRCDCGSTRHLRGYDLRSGKSYSCGCGAQDKPHRFVHGDAAKAAPAPEYGVYQNMKRRCINPKATHYDRYGGRGITVCDRWLKGEQGLTGYECFLSDMGRRPTPKHQIERGDNDAGYSKDNCGWALKIDQMRNRSNTIFVGENRESLAALCERLGLDIKLMYRRLSRGWEIDRALAQPRRGAPR